MSRKEYIRQDLTDFVPYQVDHIEDGIKLDANENPYPMEEVVRKELIQWLKKNDSFAIYPDSNCTELRKVIGNYYNLSSSQVVCGVGLDQIIDCMVRGVINPGDTVVYPNPSFSMYQSVISLNHGNGLAVDLKEDFSYDVEAMINACNDNNAKLLILCTPNNPTGNTLSVKDIKKIVSSVSCLVMIDEAYGEFTNKSSIPLIKEFDNIAVLRTFSKAYGLAGLRIGYALGSEKAIYPIEITKPPYNINTFTQLAAKTVMENSYLYKSHIENIKKEKDFLMKSLKDIEIKVYPSEANFLLIEMDEMDLDKYLREKGIYIRSMNIRGRKMYRITVGSREENILVLESIKEAFK